MSPAVDRSECCERDEGFERPAALKGCECDVGIHERETAMLACWMSRTMLRVATPSSIQDMPEALSVSACP